MTCLCTGCWLYDPPHRRRVYGDLHSVGLALVFNANAHPEGEGGRITPDWQWNVPPPLDGEKAVVLANLASSFFERRAVFVIGAGVLSEPLQKHIKEGQRSL